MSDFFLSCDWGTSAFRLRLVERATLRVLAQVKTGQGIGRMAESLGPVSPAERDSAFRDVLGKGLEKIASESGRDPAGLPIVISGMAGSTLGWRDVPYAVLPCALDGRDLRRVELTPSDPARFGPHARRTLTHRILLISGLRSEDDVMRGEECEILGLFQTEPMSAHRDRALLILPGTHSKHVRIEGERVVDFATFMTGELFFLLSSHGTLSHSVQVPEGVRNLEQFPEFLDGVREAQRRPATAALFRVRTNQVLRKMHPNADSAFLSGVLIGAELCGLGPDASPVFLSAGALTEAYARAFAQCHPSRPLHRIDPDAAETSILRAHALMVE